MKVCYVLSTSETTGGANRSFIDLLRNIDRSEVEPVVLLRRAGGIEKLLKEEDISYFIIPYINNVTTGNRIKDVIKKIYSFVMTARIRSFISHSSIDIVHNNSIPALAGMEAAYKTGIPYVCHVRENIQEGLGVDFLNPQRHMFIVNNASAIIAISNFIRSGYEFNNKVLVLHDGIDVDLYYDDKQILMREITRISIYGNLDQQKGQMIAVQAIQLLNMKGYKNITLNIVGNNENPYGERLKRFVKDEKLDNVHILGIVNDSDTLREMRKKDDINLVCSNAEGLGRVTIESMLSDTLTIAADAGATREIVEDGVTGLLFEKDNPESLAEKIQYAIDNRDLMQKIAIQGRQYAYDHYGMTQYAQKIIEVYKGIMQKQGEKSI